VGGGDTLEGIIGGSNGVGGAGGDGGESGGGNGDGGACGVVTGTNGGGGSVGGPGGGKGGGEGGGAMQLTPSPLKYGATHSHVKLPGVLMHVARVFTPSMGVVVLSQLSV